MGGEKIQELRVLAALPEDLGLVLNTYIRWLSTTSNPRSGCPMPSSDLPGTGTSKHIIEINFKDEFKLIEHFSLYKEG